MSLAGYDNYRAQCGSGSVIALCGLGLSVCVCGGGGVYAQSASEALCRDVGPMWEISEQACHALPW